MAPTTTAQDAITNEHIQTLVSRYIADAHVSRYRLIDCTRDDGADIRLVYIVDLEPPAQVVLKLARSAFATLERIEAWGTLTHQYRNAGIYCPLFLRDTATGSFGGPLSAGDFELVAWAEEFAAHRTLDDARPELAARGQSADDTDEGIRALEFSDQWAQQLGDHLGRACAAGLRGPKPAFATVFSLYDTFADEACDENLENATKLHDTFVGRPEVDQRLLDEVWQTHLANRAALEPLYRKLPRGMVQGDLSGNNLLVDDEVNLVGVIDFNLSGTETLVRYALQEAFEATYGSLTDRLADPGYLPACDRRLRVFMDSFTAHYPLSPDEIAALGPIYSVVRPITWPVVSDMLYFAREGDYDEVNARLKWMRYQQTRTDVTALLVG